MLHISEAAREREALRYEPRLASLAPDYEPLSPLSNDASPLAAENANDPVLPALAQLAVLRLNGACAFISFFDCSNEYVLAEANPTSNITSAEPELPHAQVIAIPRASSVCEYVLLQTGLEDDASHETSACLETSASPLPVSVVPDISTHPRFSHFPCTPESPPMRFFAGVPIRSPRGINIGVLTVYDSEPRTELRNEHISCLRDISFTVTSHLQAKRASGILRRSERMVRGVGSFVEGNGGMTYDAVTSNFGSFEDDGVEGSLNARQQAIHHQKRGSASLGSIGSRLAGFTPSTTASSEVPELKTISPTPDMSMRRSSVSTNLTSPSAAATSVATFGASDDDDDEHLAAVKSVFARAANIVRESVEVEGVAFLDASISTFGGLVAHGGNTNASSSSSPYSSGSDESLIEELDHPAETTCQTLGFSTSASSSIDGDVGSVFQGNVPEKFLKTLLRRYPEGKIFNFDEDGALSSDSEGESVNKTQVPETEEEDNARNANGRKPHPRSRKPWSRYNEASSLIKVIPGARSIMLIPLWHSARERWFAGGFVWTRTPSRVFTKEGEMSYLRAFGMTVMAEIARLEALMYDKAKTDVLGSLSHELRSPLHGVVAAVDLLHDTEMDAFQRDVLHSIESCGRTLLDVMNHLLDYSKINTFLRDAKEQSRAERKGRLSANNQIGNSFRGHNIRLLTSVQLDALAEESIDSVFAGHAFQKMSIAQLGATETKHNPDTAAIRRTDTLDAMESFGHQTGPTGSTHLRLGDVSIFLDIDPTEHWGFRTQPGAIRRILLNIFGNSLRYTERGFIAVSLKQETIRTKSNPKGTNLIITVADSGKGISPHFLQHHLFTPFAQEDRLSPGTGLGLSLVKQIIKSFGGQITVESQLGTGTCVRVTLPLHKRSNEPLEGSISDDQKDALSGLRVSVIGLGDSGQSRFRASSLSGFKPMSEAEVMSNVCSTWLKMQVLKAEDDEYRPDLVLCGEAELGRLASHAEKHLILAPVVVVCRNAVTAHEHTAKMRTKAARTQRVYEFVSQPIGPRKLAKALTTALSRWIEAAKNDCPSGGWPSSPASGHPLRPSSISEFDSYFPPNSGQESVAGKPEDKRDSSMTVKAVAPNGEDIRSPPSAGLQQLESPAAPHRLPETGNDDQSNTVPDELAFLLVDDNKINLQILTSFLKRLKKPYATAMNGLEAFEAFAAGPSRYCCILMDLSMPVMDGMESTRRIRELERTLKLKPTMIMALTGLASANTQQEAYASGMDLFLTKPVKLKDLAATLSSKGL
ncbi:hypothetical protein F4780DRAFT_793656 [Xylariomycetidae sp. FL0641]|nr:hypothetical protein F4780DRAFT_793656 [Xylariomycetidae sp. FL0641]